MRGARWIAVALLALTLASCGTTPVHIPTPDTITATPVPPSGPTPTPLANGPKPTPTAALLPSTATVAVPPTPFSAPTVQPNPGTARQVAQQFYEATLRQQNIAAFLTPALRARESGNGFALLGITALLFYSVDDQQLSADGNDAVVLTTIRSPAGMAKPQFAMKKQGATWAIDRVTA